MKRPLARRSAAFLAAIALLGASAATEARPGRSWSGSHGGAHFHSAPRFVYRAYPRVIVGGAIVAPWFYAPPPPVVYTPAPAYIAPPHSNYYYYCPAYGAYYPQVQSCPSGWQVIGS